MDMLQKQHDPFGKRFLLFGAASVGFMQLETRWYKTRCDEKDYVGVRHAWVG